MDRGIRWSTVRGAEKELDTIQRLNINNNGNIIPLGIVYNKFVSFEYLHPFYPPPASGNYHSVLCFYEFWIFVFFKISQTSGITQYLIYFTQHNTLKFYLRFCRWQEFLFTGAEFYSILYMYHVLYPLTSADRFHVSAIVSNASVNMGVQISFQVSAFVSFGQIPRCGILHTVFHMAAPTYIPTSSAQVFPFLYILPKPVCLFGAGHADGYEVLSHCGSDLHCSGGQ